MKTNDKLNEGRLPSLAVRMLVLLVCIVLAHPSVLAQMYGTTDPGMQDYELLPWIKTTDVRSQVTIEGCTFNICGNKQTKEAYMYALDDNPDYNPAESPRTLHIPQEVLFDSDPGKAYQVAYLSANILRNTEIVKNIYGGGFPHTTFLQIDTLFVPSSVKQIVTASLDYYISYGTPVNPCLKYWSIAEDNPYFKSIDGSVYSKDGSALMLAPFVCGDVYTVPEGVKTIDWCAFTMCTCKEVKMPESVKTVYSTAFKESKIQEVVIPGSVTYVGPKWEHGRVLSSPSTFNILGNKEVGTTVMDDFYYAFLENDSKVVYGEGVTVAKAPYCSWNKVPEGHTVVLPMSLEQLVGSCAYMSGLNIEIPANHPKYQLRDSCLVTVDDSLLCIQCRNSVNYFVPEGVKVVADGCGENICNAYCVVVPASVTRLGFYPGTPYNVTERWFGALRIEFLGLPPEPSELFVEQAKDTYRYKHSTSLYYNIMIRVPAEYEEAYRNHEFWGRCYWINDFQFRGVQGIADVKAAQSGSGKVYDLQGRPIADDKSLKGIYIRDGKKYVR